MSRMLNHRGAPFGGQMPGLVEAIVIDIPGNMAAGSDDIKKLVNQEFEQQRLQREMEERAQQMRR